MKRDPSPDFFVFLQVFSCEGGIQSYVRDLLRAYPRDRRAEVFLLRDGKDVENPLASRSLRFHYLKTKVASVGRLRLAGRLLVALLRDRPRHIYCGHINLAPLIRWLCRPLGIPYTVITYGKEVWTPLAPMARRALQQADRVWTISRYSRDRLCESNQVPIDRVAFLWCAIDGRVFRPMEPDGALVQRYGLAGSRVLMTVARLWSGDPYKGVDVTIRALPRIVREFPEVKYLVIGRGDDQPRLAQLAADLGVADRVVFAGFVPTEALPQHYNLADVYVMPSQEGFGIVYLEALASGVPVLAGDADGSADPLQDGRLGWRVPHRDPEAVAEACLEILRGDDRRCQGEWLRSQTLQKFDQPAFAEQLRQLLAIEDL